VTQCPDQAVNQGKAGRRLDRFAADVARPTRVIVDGVAMGGGWKFHIIHADVDEPFTAYTARETDSTGWFTLSEMRMRTLRLHPGFRQWVTEHTPPH
jgi:hypothetical protein